MTNLELRFLGGFVVKESGEVISTLTKPRLQSLFAFLTLHNDSPHPRSRLAGLFWPDSPDAQALANLRNLVFSLRHALPGGDQLIQADSQTIQWNPQIPFKLDVLEFERIAGAGLAHSLPQERLEATVALYRGDLLPGCDEEWVLNKREHLRQEYLTLLDALIDRYEGQRRYMEAVTVCRRLVSIDPLHTNGYPRLMRLFAILGNIPTALKTYQTYARLLKDELGIEPSAEMQALHRRLKARAIPAGSKQTMLGPGLRRRATIPQEVPSIQSSPLPLVGRDLEWQTIQTLWKSNTGGQTPGNSVGSPHMLLIRGEAGIGKSRLAEEVVRWATNQGILTAVGHCYAAEGALPYAPLVEWLHTLGLPDLDRVWLTELARLLPELQRQKGRPPAALTEAWQRLRLFDALARAILGWGEKILLVIEDLHWCDQDTLEWLHYLLRFDAHAPLLILGTVRSEEIEANPAYRKLLLGLRQESASPSERKFLEIDLGPLDESETGQLVAHAAGRTLDPVMNARIYQETEGNPLFIVETVQVELYRKGDLPDRQQLPGKSRAVLENRIRQLSLVSRDLCMLAATIGRAFSLEVLRLAYGSEGLALMAGLEEMLQKRIAREVSQGIYVFSHDKLREAAINEASGIRRQKLHQQTADALVNLAKNDGVERNGEIASHYEAAGQAARAIQHYQAAAQSARDIFANELAIQYYQRALTLAETDRLFPSNQLAQLDQGLGEMLATVGRYPEAQAAFEQALARPFLATPGWRSQIYRKICETLLEQNLHLQAIAALDRAEEALNLEDGQGPPLERQEWIQVQIARSNLFYWINRTEDMEDVLQKISPIIEAEGHPEQRIELLGQQLFLRHRRERFRVSDQTLAISKRRMELTGEMGEPYDTAWTQFAYGFDLMWHGDTFTAQKWLDQSYEMAVRIGAILLQVRILAYRNINSRLIGDVEAVRQTSQRLYEQAVSVGDFTYRGISQANLGWLAWREGDMAAAEQYCHAAVENWNRSGGQVFHWTARWVLLAVAVTRGDLAQAEQQARALMDPNPLYQPVRDSIAQELEAALRACQLNDPPEAQRSFAQALELVKNCGEL